MGIIVILTKPEPLESTADDCPVREKASVMSDFFVSVQLVSYRYYSITLILSGPLLQREAGIDRGVLSFIWRLK